MRMSSVALAALQEALEYYMSRLFDRTPCRWVGCVTESANLLAAAVALCSSRALVAIHARRKSVKGRDIGRPLGSLRPAPNAGHELGVYPCCRVAMQPQWHAVDQGRMDQYEFVESERQPK